MSDNEDPEQLTRTEDEDDSDSTSTVSDFHLEDPEQLFEAMEDYTMELEAAFAGRRRALVYLDVCRMLPPSAPVDSHIIDDSQFNEFTPVKKLCLCDVVATALWNFDP